MYKKLAVIICLVLAVIAGSRAATITWSATVANGFSLNNGAELPANNLVRLGVFSLGDGQITAAATAGDINLLNSNFVEVGSARIGDGLGGADGHFLTMTNFPNTTPNRQLMMWVLSSTNNSSNAASLASVVQLGIFYMPLALNGEWAIPVDPGSGTLDISDLTDPGTSLTLQNGATLLYGTFPKGTSTSTGLPNFGLQAPVPEPGALCLLALPALAFLAKRRRTV